MLAAAGGAAAEAQDAPLPASDGRRSLMATAAAGDLPRAGALLERLVAAGDLRLVSSRPDPWLGGHFHDSFRQFHRGVPVLGASITRQRAAGGTLSILGTLHEGIQLDVTPTFSAGEAARLLQQAYAAEPAAGERPELVILRTLAGRFALAWSVTAGDLHRYFLDARSGVVLERRPLLKRQQAAVGAGRGIKGVEKKVSVSRARGRYEAHDRLRPAEIVTLDLDFDLRRETDLARARARWSASDLAVSLTNTWSDPPVVDAHAYTGFVYDHLLRVHGWRGMDGADGRLIGMVNLSDDGVGGGNAYFIGPPFGPEKTGVHGYGRFSDGTPLTTVDIVGHEIMHGVAHHALTRRTNDRWLPAFYSSFQGPTSFPLGSARATCRHRLVRTDPDTGRRRTFRLVCQGDRLVLVANHTGAMEEAYADILGTAVERGIHGDGPRPLAADWLLGEDTGFVIRDLRDPRSRRIVVRLPPDYRGPPFENVLRPDAFENIIHFLVGTYDDDGANFILPYGSVDRQNVVRLPLTDYGGVHVNSPVLSHAFYLAVEGGRHRSSGALVTGAGSASFGQVERAFVRALIEMLPQGASMFDAADVIRLSARQLYGAESAVARAIDRALTVVGLASRSAG